MRADKTTMTSLFVALRCAVGLIWIVAGAAKMRNSSELSLTLRAYGIVPTALIPALAAGLPVGEVTLGGAVSAGVLPMVSGALAAWAFTVFAAAMAWNLANGRQFDCGCGISRAAPISWRLVGRNIALAVVASAITVGPSGGLALVRGSASVGDSPGAASLVAIPMVVVLVAVLVRLIATVRLAPPALLHDPRSRDVDHLAVVQVQGTATTAAGRS